MNEAREAALTAFMEPMLSNGSWSSEDEGWLIANFRYAFDKGIAEGVRIARDTLASERFACRDDALSAIDSLTRD